MIPSYIYMICVCVIYSTILVLQDGCTVDHLCVPNSTIVPFSLSVLCMCSVGVSIPDPAMRLHTRLFVLYYVLVCFLGISLFSSHHIAAYSIAIAS